MPWLKISDDFDMHPKVVALGTDARRWTWQRVLIYTCRYRSDVIPTNIKDVISRCDFTFLEHCVAVGLIDVDDAGVMHVHDWSRYQAGDPGKAHRQAKWRSRVDGRVDAPVDTSVDAPVDTSVDARVDADVDAPVDGVVDASVIASARARSRTRITPPKPPPTGGATICPACKVNLSHDPATAALVPRGRLAAHVAAHLVNVHDWEDDRAADIAAKTVKEAAA